MLCTHKRKKCIQQSQFSHFLKNKMVVDKLVRSKFIYFDLITIFQTYAFLIEVHWLKIRGYMLLNKITKSGGGKIESDFG